ncbi:hypothetical protein AK830_g2468 [Neonectria ditissima]|uniref:3-carboxymuconate cyclase n=1 Tax=Neonectria ditissima TaxID=78410 RepID=A0A0P7BRP3_9HYPO|nr:hypothetical protein AK830_g2468 [Neonectria ditissima]
MITNDHENAIISLSIADNGKLSRGRHTATGGAGSNAIDSTTKQPAGPDALLSQSALTVVGNNLFAVNPGSNTVTMFNIDRHDPTKLTMVGTPVAVLGEFPNTVAASEKNKLVCVGSSGAKAGVACSQFSHKGIKGMDNLRPFDLDQSTPPVGPFNTVSQVFFSNDENSLFATVKGNPPKKQTGFLAVFPVESWARSATDSGPASLSQQAVKSSPNGTAVLFGSSTIPGSQDIFVTDASFGGAVLSLDSKTDVATVKAKAAVSGQKATCWVAVSLATKTAFVADVATNRLVEMSLTDASVQSLIDLSANGDPGLIDLRTAGNFVYALSPGNGTTHAAITVVDAIRKIQVQHFDLAKLGGNKNAQGMAVKL